MFYLVLCCLCFTLFLFYLVCVLPCLYLTLFVFYLVSLLSCFCFTLFLFHLISVLPYFCLTVFFLKSYLDLILFQFLALPNKTRSTAHLSVIVVTCMRNLSIHVSVSALRNLCSFDMLDKWEGPTISSEPVSGNMFSGGCCSNCHVWFSFNDSSERRKLAKSTTEVNVLWKYVAQFALVKLAIRPPLLCIYCWRIIAFSAYTSLASLTFPIQRGLDGR